MKILLSVAHSGFLRHFDSAIRLLAERGHSIHISLGRRDKLGDNPQLQQLVQDYGSVSYSKDYGNFDPTWHFLAKNLRVLIDYLRYFHPSYQDAFLLRERMESYLPKWYLGVTKLPIFKNSLFRQVLTRFFQLLLKAIPKNKPIERLIKQEKPDIILVTPLVEYGSPQDEYIQIAKMNGIKTGLCVGSWDNLTNKGSIRIMPDLITVWNEAQKQEAVELHGVCPDRVTVTGALTYDHWFEWQSSTSRAAFCQEVGLDENQPFVLYLCSSPPIAPRPLEVKFVEKWIRAIRGSELSHLKEIGILIRPHPQNAAQWEDVDFSEFGNVAIWPRAGAIPVDASSKSGYYDSMYHSFAIIGVNTSGQIESAILGRPVFTILAPEFSASQQGTLHFRHLAQTNGGLLQMAKDFDEHLAQLSLALGDDERIKEKSQQFIQYFVRPYGLEVAATPLLVDAIEQLGAKSPPAPEPLSFWLYALQILLYPLAILSLPNKEKRLQALRQLRKNLKKRTLPSVANRKA